MDGVAEFSGSVLRAGGPDGSSADDSVTEEDGSLILVAGRDRSWTPATEVGSGCHG